jgi:hypothetical protein
VDEDGASRSSRRRQVLLTLRRRELLVELTPVGLDSHWVRRCGGPARLATRGRGRELEAHDALEQFERVSEAGEESDASDGQLARTAAVVVAVLAAFLAIATFLSNEAVKEVITGETRSADTNAQLEANSVKTIIAGADAVLLRVVGSGNAKEAAAAGKAEELETAVQSELQPVDRRLSAKIRADEHTRGQAEHRHLLYELAEVGIQVGIVLAGISILVRRRWLLASGGVLGAAGVVVLIAGLLY